VLFLANNIDFEEDFVVPGDAWGPVKQEITKKDNPAGHIPIVYYGDMTLTEHHSIMRYFAKKAGVYGKDDEKDFAQDCLGEFSKEWRSDWVGTLFDPVKKEKYVAEGNASYLGIGEKILDRYHKHFEGPEISLGDALLFSQLRDLKLTGYPIDAAKYPHLTALLAKVAKNAKVKAWCDAHGGGY